VFQAIAQDCRPHVSTATTVMLNLFGCAGLRLSIHGLHAPPFAPFGAIAPWMLKQVQHDAVHFSA
jgi:hypothetical protein